MAYMNEYDDLMATFPQGEFTEEMQEEFFDKAGYFPQDMMSLTSGNSIASPRRKTTIKIERKQKYTDDMKEIFATNTLQEHTNSIDSMALNPANQLQLVTGSHDKTIKVWDINQMKSIMTLEGHDRGIWSVVYDNSGAMMATASPDTKVKLWDTKSGKCIQTLYGHSMFCYKAVFDSNSVSVATVGADKMLNVWDVRITKNPVMRVFSNSESKNCLLNCDFLPNDQ